MLKVAELYSLSDVYIGLLLFINKFHSDIYKEPLVNEDLIFSLREYMKRRKPIAKIIKMINFTGAIPPFQIDSLWYVLQYYLRQILLSKTENLKEKLGYLFYLSLRTQRGDSLIVNCYLGNGPEESVLEFQYLRRFFQRAQCSSACYMRIRHADMRSVATARLCRDKLRRQWWPFGSLS